MNVVNAKNLNKSYDKFSLKDFSLSIEKGKLYGILGPNGSGKSTIIKILTGQLLPEHGSVEILKTNPIKDEIKTKEIIGIIPEQETPPSFLTVYEYLSFVCNLRKLSLKKIEKYLSLLELEEEKNSLIKDLSRGNKQKVLFAQAFIHEPKIVFIDEPLINLDPIIQKKIKEFLIKYVKEGNTIILSTHILAIAEEICTDVCILKNGKTLYQGSIEEIKSKNKNLESYFIKLIENDK